MLLHVKLTLKNQCWIWVKCYIVVNNGIKMSSLLSLQFVQVSDTEVLMQMPFIFGLYLKNTLLDCPIIFVPINVLNHFSILWLFSDRMESFMRVGAGGKCLFLGFRSKFDSAGEPTLIRETAKKNFLAWPIRKLTLFFKALKIPTECGH